MPARVDRLPRRPEGIKALARPKTRWVIAGTSGPIVHRIPVVISSRSRTQVMSRSRATCFR